MKFILLISTAIYTVTVLAAPGAVRLYSLLLALIQTLQIISQNEC